MFRPLPRIQLVTDSTAYLTSEEIRRLQAHVLSLQVITEDRSFPETEIDSEAFAGYLRKAPKVPTTSQPPPARFLELYEVLASAGEPVISLHISSGLSGTWQAASAVAAGLEGAPIHVVDSLSAGMGLKLQVEAAHAAIAAEMPPEKVIEAICRVRDRHNLFLIVDSLEYLYKGGRIGGAQSLIGSLLQIKPILWLQEGRIEIFEKIRTRRKAFQRVAEFIAERWRQEGPLRLDVGHVYAPEAAKEFCEQIVDLVPEAKPTFSDIGPVIAVHVGPGTVGVAMAPLEKYE
ncbi:DegV family EDD domain-containing protein [Heliobacterium undosum]|uniref:DegV family EDD domain-containing protein n=1 Tax=Heliomicrobium undosum TaxID=121734 RepID=A0A845L1A1_9FIRM|nr:DegV family protein [Heliomicrobium undosum]MZP28739.1 DegV family EDD domain-containing protein [Heliomicrobium undosum]